jgi:hypothetical protein
MQLTKNECSQVLYAMQLLDNEEGLDAEGYSICTKIAIHGGFPQNVVELYWNKYLEKIAQSEAMH